jgi:hypothetical protein
MLPDEKELGDAVVAAREMLSAEGRKLGFVGFKIIEIETGRSAHEERL